MTKRMIKCVFYKLLLINLNNFQSKKSITMNTTTYWSDKQTSFRNNLRRNSLETIIKKTINSNFSEQQSFRKSFTSFDKMTNKIKNEFPQICYEKQMDSNIYFNPQSRNNFFKNLIDSYFDKSEKIQERAKFVKSGDYSRKGSYLLRKSILSKKNKPKEEGILPSSQNEKEKDKYTSMNQSEIKQFNTTSNNEKHAKRPTKPEPLNRAKSHLQKHPSQQQKDQMIDYIQSSSLILQKPIPNQPFQQYSFLRKITEAIDDEDFDEEIQLNSREELLNTTFIRSQSSFSRLEDHKVLVYQNSVIKLFTSWENDKRYRIKQFKNNIFLKRHKKAIQYGAYSFWKPYKFNQLSLITPYIFPLKDLLFKLLPHPTSPQSFIIQPRKFFYRLTANNYQELFLFFKQLIKDIQKISRKVINNKINLSNLFYFNGKLCVGDWQFSAIKQENKIQGNYFQSRVQPILKCDQDWLVSPQYLAPQILQSIDDAKKPFDMWMYQNASDIYSIGLTFLQIVTLIPIWMQHRTSVKSRIMKPREGFLSTPTRSATKILEKQKLLVSRIPTFLERQLALQEKNWRFFNLLLRMIEPNPSKRITIDQLMKEIQ